MLETDLPKKVAENIEHFTGRAWLLPKILEWWDGDEQLFLLSGGPGTGKSMILAWLAGFGPEPEDQTARSQLATLRGATKAAHFCQSSSRNTTPQAFADSVANQLTRSVPKFGDALAATLAERVQIHGIAQADSAESGAIVAGNAIAEINLAGLGDELSFDRAFVEPLRKLYKPGNYSEPILILVDALDETLPYTGVLLIDLLSRLSGLPAVRILAATRDDPQVLKFFRSVKLFDLIHNADRDVDDVKTYAELRVSELTSVKQTSRTDFVKRLAEKADGVFLYAALVLDELLKNSTSVLPDLDSYALPNGLPGLYHDFLVRKLPSAESSWFTEYEPLLGLIAVAQDEGLTTQQLATIIGRDVRAPLRVCKQYLTGALPDGPFRVFHKSFADYLLLDEENIDYHIDAAGMHQRIADHYRSNKLDWSKCDDYGLNNLAVHLAAANRTADLVTLIEKPWMKVRYDRSGFTYGEFQGDIDLALRTVRAESSPQLRHLIHLKTAALVVQEQVQSYEDEDLEILVGLGRSEEALKYVRLRNTAEKRFGGLLKIYRELVSSQQHALAMKLSRDIRAAANEIGDPAQRVSKLHYLADALIDANDPEASDVLSDMKKGIEGIQDRSNRSWAQREFVSALVKANLLDEAMKISVSIDDSTQKAFAWESIAISFVASNRFHEAERIADAIKTSMAHEPAVQRIYARTLAGIARGLAPVNDGEASLMFNTALEVAESINEKNLRNEAFHNIATALTELGWFSEAQRIAGRIEYWQKDQALLEVVDATAKKGDFERSKSLVEAFEDKQWRSFALRDIAHRLAASGRFDEALTLQDTIEDISSRAFAQRLIAAELLMRKDDRAERVLNDAVEESDSIQDFSQRKNAFRHLARIFIKANDLDRASRVFEELQVTARAKPKKEEHSAAVRGVRNALASVEDNHADRLVVEVNDSMEWLNQPAKNDVGSKALTDSALVIYPDDPVRAREFFAVAERTACEDWSEWTRDEALVHLVSGLARSREFDEALRVSSTIVGGGRRVAALCHLAEHLVLANDPRGQQMLTEGLAVADKAETGTNWVEAKNLREEAMRLSRNGDAAAAQLWLKAQDTAGSPWTDWFWGHEEYRAEGLIHIAIAMERTRDPRTESTIDLAYQTALSIPYENTRDSTLRKLIDGLLEVKRPEMAEKVLSDMRDDSDRLAVIRLLVEEYATAGRLESAVRVARLVTSDYYRREIMRSVATAFARENKIVEAIEVLEEISLDGFIASLGMVHAAWTAAPEGAVLSSMRTVTEVAGWVRPDWHQIHTVLMT